MSPSVLNSRIAIDQMSHEVKRIEQSKDLKALENTISIEIVQDGISCCLIYLRALMT